jgi:hypothetical protein
VKTELLIDFLESDIGKTTISQQFLLSTYDLDLGYKENFKELYLVYKSRGAPFHKSKAEIVD